MTDFDDFDYDLDDDILYIADFDDEEEFSYTVKVDSDSEAWQTNVTLDGSYNLEIQILNDCLARFRDRGGLREEVITDKAREELGYIAKDITNNYSAGYSIKYEIVYQGTFYPDDEKVVIDNVHIWERKAAHKRAYSETGKNIPLTSENVKDIIVNCDVEKAVEESDEGEIHSDDPSYYFTVEAQTPDGETRTIVKDVELSWQDQVDRLQVDIPSDLSDYMISSYDVSASIDEDEDEGEDWKDMGDYGYMDHYHYIYDDVHVVITLYLTK